MVTAHGNLGNWGNGHWAITHNLKERILNVNIFEQ
jgi:hypothetical protein